MKKELGVRVATFRPVDLPSGERTKLEEQIMERALALWSRKQIRRIPVQSPAPDQNGSVKIKILKF